MNICLFGLTGFGNSVLESLLNCNFIKRIFVITRKEKGPFPYYRREPIEDLCIRNSIEFIYNMDIQQVINFSPDLLIAATFHRKIPCDIISISKRGGINIHLSLLPKYRGATPTNWAIINGESKTGITFHLLSEEFDKGDILLQKGILIGNATDGELREKLARLAGGSVEGFIKDFMTSKVKPMKVIEFQGSYFPKITSKEGIDIVKSGNFKRNDITRGLTPYPGMSIIE